MASPIAYGSIRTVHSFVTGPFWSNIDPVIYCFGALCLNSYLVGHMVNLVSSISQEMYLLVGRPLLSQ